MIITDNQELKKVATEYRVWQGISSIAVTKTGRIFVTFYSGGTNEEVGNYAIAVLSDDGISFTEPVVKVYEENKRCFDPNVWIDPLGRLWITWSLMPLGGVYGAICEDPDAERLVWGEEFFIGHDVMMNKPTVLSSGEWLFPIAVWDGWRSKLRIRSPYYETTETETGSFVYRSIDQGKTFEKLGAADVENRQFDEHMVLELKDGTLAMYVRTWYGIGVSYSYDKGMTWTEGKDSGLGGPGSRFHIRRLKSGRILLINHVNYQRTPENPQGRNNLAALLSEDDGKTWKYQLMLDERNEVSYPDATEAEDGFIYITYDRERGCGKFSYEEATDQAREILYAKITEEDIIAGKLVDEQSRLKCIVSGLGDYAAEKEKLHFGKKPEKVSVTDYGAIPNSKEVQTKMIQQAIDDVYLKGGGEVCIPTGEYLVTTLRLRSNVCLHLMQNTVLKASRNIDDYFQLKYDTIEPVDENILDESPWERGAGQSTVFHKFGSRWHNGVIRALDAENISIIGEKGSVIDGANCFDENGEEYYRGPHGVSICNCNGVDLKGYTVRHSGNWANMLQNSRNIAAIDLTVIAGHDGIHFTSCDYVAIRRCHFYTGDDCVAGFDNHHVIVEDCELNSSCSAFRLGGTDVLIRRCHAYGPGKYKFRGCMTIEDKRAGIHANDTDRVEAKFAHIPPRNNMLSFFTYYADHSVVIRNTPGNIVIRDCEVECADRFLHFNYSGNEMWQNNRPLTSITFEKIKATGIAMPLVAYGDSRECLQFTMKNMDFSFREGLENTEFLRMANVGKIVMENVIIRNAGNANFIKMWGENKPIVEMKKITGIIAEEYIISTKEAFVCKPI